MYLYLTAAIIAMVGIVIFYFLPYNVSVYSRSFRFDVICCT